MFFNIFSFKLFVLFFCNYFITIKFNNYLVFTIFKFQIYVRNWLNINGFLNFKDQKKWT